MTNQEAINIKRLVGLCLQINVFGKREVDFRLYSHIKAINIEIYKEQCENDKLPKTYSCYYDYGKDKRFAKSNIVQTYQEVVEVLEKILEEDMRIWG